MAKNLDHRLIVPTRAIKHLEERKRIIKESKPSIERRKYLLTEMDFHRGLHKLNELMQEYFQDLEEQQAVLWEDNLSMSVLTSRGWYLFTYGETPEYTGSAEEDGLTKEVDRIDKNIRAWEKEIEGIQEGKTLRQIDKEIEEMERDIEEES